MRPPAWLAWWGSGRGTEGGTDRPLAERPKPKMVGWYDPHLLLATGMEVFISQALGQRSDYRTMEDVGLPQEAIDYTRDRNRATQPELWFDYMADTGDGWESTYGMACLVAQPWIELGDRRLPHGAFLLLGGDEVYPSASKRIYRERLVGPLEAALPRGAVPRRDLFAIPGNHDWYDGLVSFSRLFTQERTLGAWQTRQRRSYFALRLPRGWWLWAVDIQLESDIDVGQLNYFRSVACALSPGDGIILASAEPDWLYRDIKDPLAESNLAVLEQKIILPTGADVHVWVAGDVHNYRRHEHTRDPRYQRITSGGGGAYLSATHTPVGGGSATSLKRTVRVGEQTFHQQFTYPSPATSLRLSFLNLLFPLNNWRFGMLTGLAYMTLTWGTIGGSLVDAAQTAIERYPARLVWLLLVLGAFVFYADREVPTFRWLGGTLHGLVHIICAFAIAGWSAAILGGPGVVNALVRLGANFVGGALVGPLVMGVYLLLASNLFGAHTDQAFAALRIKDFKHFLRFHIRTDGVLEIFPIAVPTIPRQDEAAAQYFLIEGPVRVDRGGGPPPAPRE
jgi:hypothetical protein